MLIDLKCKSCGCGPEKHSGTSVGCQCGQCHEYKSPLTEPELAVALAAVDHEAEQLREYKRLVEYVERRFPMLWFGSFSKLRESLLERMREDREGKGG